jgi:RimJ/RimL family protein N-acetyltransferase
LQALRVQLKTDENNLRSQKAIEKIERQFDGIIRNDMLRDNNTRRNSAGLQYYCPGMEREKNKADFPYCKISSMPAANKGIALVNRSFRSGRYNPQF